MQSCNLQIALTTCLQFYEMVTTEKALLGVYYECYETAPKYLLLSGGPSRMKELREPMQLMLVCIRLLLLPDSNLTQQEQEFPHIIAQWDQNPEVTVPLGGAIAASVLCTNQFHGTLLAGLSPENLAVFPENIFVSNMVVRKLILPGGTESKDFFHGSTT